MQSCFRKIVICFSLLFCFGNAFPQGSYLKLKKIIETYNDSNFTQTITDGKKFLVKNPNYEGAELLILYQMMITSYISERNQAKSNNDNIRVNDLNSELTPLVNNFLTELRKGKMPNTWLSKMNDWHQGGKEWNDWRNRNIAIYEDILNQIKNFNQNSSTKIDLDNSLEKNKGFTLEFFKITEKSFDAELDSIYDKYVGFYSLINDEASIKRKNILLKNSFIASDSLAIKNYLIFKDNQELFLLELNDRNNNTSQHLAEIKKLVISKEKIQRFKSRFKTPHHGWIYHSFLKNFKENKGLFKIKRGKYEIAKKWKTIMRKNFSDFKFKEVPGNFTSFQKTKILYNGVEFLDLNKIDDDDRLIRSSIRANLDLLMDISDYNYSNSSRKYIDLQKNVLDNSFNLLDDFEKISFSSLYENRISNLYSSQRKNINKIVFEKDGNFEMGFIKNSKLFQGSFQPSFDRLIKLNLNGITISSGKNFSYSEANFKKQPNSERILVLFKDDFLKNGNINGFENKLLSLTNIQNKILKSNNKIGNENIKASSELIDNTYSSKRIESFGQGKTYKEALDMALSAALEQSGSYMSSETRIEGDRLTKDELIKISGDYVENYKVLNSYEVNPNEFRVEISAIISPSRKSDYIQERKNTDLYFDSRSFASKINEQKRNKKNEEIKILSLCENEFDRFIKESISFNLTSTQPVRNSKNKSNWDLDFTVEWSLNDNFDKFQDYFWKSLNEFALTEDDLKVYNKDNTDYFKFGNLYFRSQKSINILVRFLTSINYYPSNFYLNIYGKKYFPQGISYDRTSGKRVQRKSNFRFLSSDINISGLVFMTANQTEKKRFKYHSIDRIYTNGARVSGYVPKNESAKRFIANGKALYQNIFLKNGKIDYRKVENMNLSSELFIDETSINKSGTHKLSITITEKQLDNMNDDIDFSDNNRSNEVNYIYSARKKSTSAREKVSSNNSYSSSKKSQASNSTIAKIIGDNIWVRNSPTNGDVIMYLESNTQVNLLGYCCNETIRGKNNYWYKIDLEGKTGWVFGSQLRFLDDQFNKSKNPPKKDLKDWIPSTLYSNLKSYWAFNGKTNALVGLPFAGNTYNSDYAADRFGNARSSYSSNRYLTSDISSLYVGNKFTMSFWIFYTGNRGAVFKISETSEKHMQINVSNDKIQLKLTAPGRYWGTNTKLVDNSKLSKLKINQWNHVVIGLSFGSNNVFKPYYSINGSWNTGTYELDNIDNFRPKKIETGIIPVVIDDVSLWNKLFTKKEAEFIYNFHKNTDLIREAKTTF